MTKPSLQEQIDALTDRLTQLEVILKNIVKPEDMLYKKDVKSTYECVLRDRTRLLKKRDGL